MVKRPKEEGDLESLECIEFHTVFTCISSINPNVNSAGTTIDVML